MSVRPSTHRKRKGLCTACVGESTTDAIINIVLVLLRVMRRCWLIPQPCLDHGKPNIGAAVVINVVVTSCNSSAGSVVIIVCMRTTSTMDVVMMMIRKERMSAKEVFKLWLLMMIFKVLAIA